MEKGLTDAQTHGWGIATPAGWGCTPGPWEGSSCFLLSLAEAVVLNMEAGGMVKLLFPTQVSAKRRVGGWGRCWTWQSQRAGDVMLSGDGVAGVQCKHGEWRMGGSAGRAVPLGPMDAWHMGGRGGGPGGPSRLALLLGGRRDEPHRGGTPLLLGYRGHTRRGRELQGAGVPGEEEGPISGRWEWGLQGCCGECCVGRGWIPGWHRMDNGGGVGRVHICTLTKRENNMKAKWGSFEVKGWPGIPGHKAQPQSPHSEQVLQIQRPQPRHRSERGVAGPVFVFCTVALRAETDVLPPPCLWFRSTRPGSMWFPGESQSPRANARF